MIVPRQPPPAVPCLADEAVEAYGLPGGVPEVEVEAAHRRTAGVIVLVAVQDAACRGARPRRDQRGHPQELRRDAAPGLPPRCGRASRVERAEELGGRRGGQGVGQGPPPPALRPERQQVGALRQRALRRRAHRRRALLQLRWRRVQEVPTFAEAPRVEERANPLRAAGPVLLRDGAELGGRRLLSCPIPARVPGCCAAAVPAAGRAAERARLALGGWPADARGDLLPVVRRARPDVAQRLLQQCRVLLRPEAPPLCLFPPAARARGPVGSGAARVRAVPRPLRRRGSRLAVGGSGRRRRGARRGDWSPERRHPRPRREAGLEAVGQVPGQPQLPRQRPVQRADEPDGRPGPRDEPPRRHSVDDLRRPPQRAGGRFRVAADTSDHGDQAAVPLPHQLQRPLLQADLVLVARAHGAGPVHQVVVVLVAHLRTASVVAGAA
mmetsp:Transcript_74716/g.211101  ORF Transcript_74716/g.211101 Transcript_74716/m.211101 type:complete len:439 (+) Transcript_74716:396-1712(+)